MKLYLLSPSEDPFISQLPELFEAGVDWFQYRRRGLADRTMYRELKQVVEIGRDRDVEIFVNDRPDLALATDADGVHLGNNDLPPKAVKQEWPSLQVGATQRAFELLVEGADYYGVGPVFTPESKVVDMAPCGWEGIEEVLSRTKKPVFGIGGITARQLKDAPRDLAGVAVISAVWDEAEPVKAVEDLLTVMRSEF